MKKSLLIVLLSLGVSILLTGCWNNKEINDMLYALGLGIDKVNNEFQVTVQVINSKEFATGQETSSPPVAMYTARGKTLFDAIRQLSEQAPRKIFYAHLRILAFGEDFARDGIEKSLDLLSRNPEIRSDFYVIVVRDNIAYNLLKILTPIDEVSAIKIFNSLQNSEEVLAENFTIELTELINNLASPSKSAVITGVRLKGNPELGNEQANIDKVEADTQIETQGLGVFKEDHLIDWLNADESTGLSYILGKVKNTITNIPCEKERFIGIESNQTKTKMKGKFVNGKPVINIYVDIIGRIAEVECHIDLTKEENIKEIEKLAEKNVEEKIEWVIKKAQTQYKSDIFGFGETLHRADYKTWRKMENKWESFFISTKTNVKVNLKITNTDTITNPFFNK